MHAHRRARCEPAGCDPWEEGEIPPGAVLKAHLQPCVKDIFYLTENMVGKALPCLIQGTCEQ